MFNIDMEKVNEKAKALKELASETIVKTVNAAERAATSAKVKFKITSKEMEIKDEYKKIGKIIYDAYNENTEADDEKIAERCVCIDNLNNEIAELNASVADKTKESADVCTDTVTEIEE